METFNKNWFAILLTAVVFGLLGFLLGSREGGNHNHSGCPMMKGQHTSFHDIMIDGDKAIFIPEVKLGEEGERIIVIPPPPPPTHNDTMEIESVDDIENIDVFHDKNGEEKTTLRVKTKKE